MGAIKPLGRFAWRLNDTENNTTTPLHEPDKSEIFAFVDAVDLRVEEIAAAIAGGRIGFTTEAAMNAALGYEAGILAELRTDPPAPEDAVYIKVGAVDAGSWEFFAPHFDTLFEARLADIERGLLATVGDGAVWAVRDILGNIPLMVDVDGNTRPGIMELEYSVYNDGAEAYAIHRETEAITKLTFGEFSAIRKADSSGLQADIVGVPVGGGNPRPRKQYLGGTTQFLDTVTTVVGSRQTGQSNAAAYGAVNAINTSPQFPGRSMMFGVGLRTVGDHNYYNLSKRVKLNDLRHLVDLHEATAFGHGETVASNAAAQMIALNAASVGTIDSNHGIGGATYAQIKKGTVVFDNVAEAIKQSAIICGLNGLSFKERFCEHEHGESYGATTAAIVAADLVEYQNDLTDAAQAITSQAEEDILLLGQLAINFDVALGQLAAALANPTKIACLFPGYILTYIDDAHRTALAQAKAGVYRGKAKNAIYDGATPATLACYPIAAVQTGTQIDVQFNRPEGILAIDTILVTDPGDKGIAFSQTGGSATAISSIALKPATTDSLRIVMTVAPNGTNKKLRFGNGGNILTPGPTTGPRCNIRDTSAFATSISGVSYLFHNWCLMSEIAVI